MKFFTVFAAVLALACASPADWSIHELSSAIQNPTTPPALIPVLEEALNELMLQSYLGSPQTTTTVSTAVQDFSSWTLNELSEAIQDPATNPELAIYLEHALNSMMAEIMAGGQPESVIVATPIGLLPVEATIVPTPAEAVAPAPVESVVAPASSPLVQIIINVKSQQEAGPVVPEPTEVPVNPIDIISVNPINPVVPEPVVLPQPVLPGVVIPEPVVLPEPVLPEVVIPEPVIPEPVVLPQPVLPEVVVIPQPVVLPAPVDPVVEVNPVDVIAVNPLPVVNPIDVIAVTAPEVNPIDILAPVPTPVGAIHVVGPM